MQGTEQISHGQIKFLCEKFRHHPAVHLYATQPIYGKLTLLYIRYIVHKGPFLYHDQVFFPYSPSLLFPALWISLSLCTKRGGLKCLSENKCYPELESWSFSSPLMHLWVPCSTSLMNHRHFKIKPHWINNKHTHANAHILYSTLPHTKRLQMGEIRHKVRQDRNSETCDLSKAPYTPLTARCTSEYLSLKGSDIKFIKTNWLRFAKQKQKIASLIHVWMLAVVLTCDPYLDVL